MSLKSLNHILDRVVKDPNWDDIILFQNLLSVWLRVVGVELSQKTKLMALRNKILYVATQSASLSQSLTLNRRKLLSKLNASLTVELIDIRFSSGYCLGQLQSEVAFSLDNHHPSEIITADFLTSSGKTTTTQEAFQKWMSKKKVSTHSLPLCPECQSPTPLGELERWQVCAYCFARSLVTSKKP